jgi:prepilin-type processing-associated H-X9-DG protein
VSGAQGSLILLLNDLKNANVFLDPSVAASGTNAWSAAGVYAAGQACNYAYWAQSMSMINVKPDSGLAGNVVDTSQRAQFGNVLFADGHVTGFTGTTWYSNTNVKSSAGTGTPTVGVASLMD